MLNKLRLKITKYVYWRSHGELTKLSPPQHGECNGMDWMDMVGSTYCLHASLHTNCMLRVGLHYGLGPRNHGSKTLNMFKLVIGSKLEGWFLKLGGVFP